MVVIMYVCLSLMFFSPWQCVRNSFLDHKILSKRLFEEKDEKTGKGANKTDETHNGTVDLDFPMSKYSTKGTSY